LNIELTLIINNYIKYYLLYIKVTTIKIIKVTNMTIITMGIGDWGLGIGPNPQSPIPNPQYFQSKHELI